jgi:hypothetical protein
VCAGSSHHVQYLRFTLSTYGRPLVLFEIAGQRIPSGFASTVAIALPPATLQHYFADRDTRSSDEIGLGPILNNPAALLEE